ncbi:MAG: histidine kinase [Fluviicola sp.]|nr:histidine kinase [Fluviicola sp.]
MIQVIIWIIYLFLPFFVIDQPIEIIKSDDAYVVSYVISSCFSILFFYYNYLYAIPRFAFQKKIGMYLLSIFLFTLLVIIAVKTVNTVFSIQFNTKPIINSFFFVNYHFRFVLIFGVSFGLSFYKRHVTMETNRVLAELQLLKAQIDPHFLFNTLNVIYAQALMKSNETADNVAKIAGIMRYVITDVGEDKVPLVNELNYLKNYLDLQEARLTTKTNLIFEVIGETTDKKIEPFLFISFIENAFKYGVSTELETTIWIKIEIRNGQLILTTKNDKIKSPNNISESTNTGIKTTKKRLELSYPNAHQLEIVDSLSHFEVHLNIILS